MRPHLLLLVCIMLGSGICKAQDYAITTPPPKAPSTKKDPRPMKDRLWFGGGGQPDVRHRGKPGCRPPGGLQDR